MEFIFEIIVAFLEFILEPIYELITKENRKMNNKTLRKIAKGTVTILFSVVVLIIFMCLSKLIRGYWL